VVGLGDSLLAHLHWLVNYINSNNRITPSIT
jgi:hypothetical protein